ncbi:peptidase S10 [Trinickia terrae]|uniref:Peptidase S10 n=1 Tax=Trinickia terrae TaxID=2571161 RepID=A0A4U1IG22_9BURK|nr:peptidase S10 [Trinickia terrae]TKC92505.1 peptidase S10 [Trinickia terrae]
MRYRFAISLRGFIAAASTAVAAALASASGLAANADSPAASDSAPAIATPLPAASAPGDQPAPGAQHTGGPASETEPSGATRAAAVPVPPETASVTRHSIRIDGHKLDYTAKAGNLLLRNNAGDAQASVFYVAYTVDAPKEAASGHAKAPAQRPVTFLFNGGPGAGSLFLLIGSFGPKRVRTASPSVTPPAPYVLADNPDSLLDKSDLVFVDAVGTGFSKPVGSATGKQFWGVDEDLDAFAHFIERYLTVNQRWNSPKFLVGESYGTARAAMLAYKLDQENMAVNGVVLLSSVLNSNVRAPGYDFVNERYLPSFAAIAWYHGKLDPKPADLPGFLDEVRAYATGPYAQALAKGDTLSDQERDAVAAQVARFTGLDVRYVEESRLRIWPSHFRKELLRSASRTVGRYDARFEGIDYDDASDSPDGDASVSGISSAFDAAFHQHLAQDLHYAAQDRYRVFNDTALKQWNWKHRTWSGEELAEPYAAGDLAQAMRQNPRLQVLSANGYFDLATPFFATEYDLAHMGLDPSLRSNIRITYYPTGHMIYLDDAALHALKGDLARFYDAATGGTIRNK